MDDSYNDPLKRNVQGIDEDNKNEENNNNDTQEQTEEAKNIDNEKDVKLENNENNNGEKDSILEKKEEEEEKEIKGTDKEEDKEKEKEKENKKHIFYYPSLYPNILTYNSNEEESKDLWEKRFNDYYDEKQINCELCGKGFQLFLCKKIQIKDNSQINEIILDKKTKLDNLINKGLNIKSLGFLSNGISMLVKESFESYKMTLSLSLIIESRLRESFYLKKNEKFAKNKIYNVFFT